MSNKIRLFNLTFMVKDRKSTLKSNVKVNHMFQIDIYEFKGE